MGFKQTDAHKTGKGSYHQIGLVRGQFGNIPHARWVTFLADAGFDGYEAAGWELDLRQADTDEGAALVGGARFPLRGNSARPTKHHSRAETPCPVG